MLCASSISRPPASRTQHPRPDTRLRGWPPGPSTDATLGPSAAARRAPRSAAASTATEGGCDIDVTEPRRGGTPRKETPSGESPIGDAPLDQREPSLAVDMALVRPMSTGGEHGGACGSGGVGIVAGESVPRRAPTYGTARRRDSRGRPLTRQSLPPAVVQRGLHPHTCARRQAAATAAPPAPLSFRLARRAVDSRRRPLNPSARHPLWRRFERRPTAPIAPGARPGAVAAPSRRPPLPHRRGGRRPRHPHPRPPPPPRPPRGLVAMAPALVAEDYRCPICLDLLYKVRALPGPGVTQRARGRARGRRGAADAPHPLSTPAVRPHGYLVRARLLLHLSLPIHVGVERACGVGWGG